MKTSPSIEKALSEKPLGYILAIIAGTLGGPIGWVVSPLVLLVLCQIMPGKEGKQPNRFLVWAAIGIVGAPLSLAPIINSSSPEKRATGAQPVAPTYQQQPLQQPAAPAPSHSGSGSGVTMANFQKLQTGMSYEQVSQILGGPGEELSSTEIAGTKSRMYMWRPEGLAGVTGSNMNAMFQDNMLMSKSQFGLR